jgi:hypothetical protein
MGSYSDFRETLPIYEKAMKEANPHWRKLYEAALLELERDKLLEYIELAEHAIHAHASGRINPAHHNPQELQAIQDALHALSLLRRSVLKE